MATESAPAKICGEAASYNSSPENSSSLSPATALHSTVQDWSKASGRDPDMLIYVNDFCFHLHKEVLTTRSRYLKRALTEISEISISPTLNITADTFTVISNFCYGGDIILTLRNIAALRTAADLLEMTEMDAIDGAENLQQITESYFCRAVTLDQSYASQILQSSLRLLPEAEETASLPSRCFEVLSKETDSESAVEYLQEAVSMLVPEDFRIIVVSMRSRFSTHDQIYRIIDLYFKEHWGSLMEEQRVEICNLIDCDKLSPEKLLDAVRNPRMPLRFVVQAMLIEQIIARREIASSMKISSQLWMKNRDDLFELGASDEREAALRQTAHLKGAMDATRSRIQMLEKDLGGMKMLLRESEFGKSELQKGRSASFRAKSTNKVERGQRGSVSTASHEFSAAAARIWNDGCVTRKECLRKDKKTVGRLIKDALKSAFRMPSRSKRGKQGEKPVRENKVAEAVQIMEKEDGEDLRGVVDDR